MYAKDVIPLTILDHVDSIGADQFVGYSHLHFLGNCIYYLVGKFLIGVTDGRKCYARVFDNIPTINCIISLAGNQT